AARSTTDCATPTSRRGTSCSISSATCHSWAPTCAATWSPAAPATRLTSSWPAPSPAASPPPLLPRRRGWPPDPRRTAGVSRLVGRGDAVVVAAPTAHHHAVAGEFLARGTHALVEKPLTADPARAAELVELAAKHAAVLQVGHVERFNPAFEELQRRPLRPKY